MTRNLKEVYENAGLEKKLSKTQYLNVGTLCLENLNIESGEIIPCEALRSQKPVAVMKT